MGKADDAKFECRSGGVYPLQVRDVAGRAVLGRFAASDRLTAEFQAPDGTLVEPVAATWIDAGTTQYLLKLPDMAPGTYRLRAWAEHLGESVPLLDVAAEVAAAPPADMIRIGRFVVSDADWRPGDADEVFEWCALQAIRRDGVAGIRECVAYSPQFAPVDRASIGGPESIPVYQWWSVRQADGLFAVRFVAAEPRVPVAVRPGDAGRLIGDGRRLACRECGREGTRFFSVTLPSGYAGRHPYCDEHAPAAEDAQRPADRYFRNR